MHPGHFTKVWGIGGFTVALTAWEIDVEEKKEEGGSLGRTPAQVV